MRDGSRASKDGRLFSVTGVNEIQTAMKELGKVLGKKICNKAIRQGLKPLHKAIKQEAPIGDGPGEHGSIKKNVKIKAMKRSRTGFGINIIIRGTSRGTDPYWAGMVEYGTKRQPAQHYMLKCFKRLGQSVKTDIMKRIRQGIEDELRKKRTA